MNNRIMAMLLALVVAMFICIAPVKAEAAEVGEHTHYDNNENCVCDYNGCKEPVHTASETWSSDGDGHYKLCINCDEELDEDPHTFEYFYQINATCEEDGNIAYRKCTICGTLIDWTQSTVRDAEDVILHKLGHQPNGIWVQDKSTHYQGCANGCETKLEEEAHTPGDVKVYNSDTTKHFQQCTVCFKSMNIAAHVDGDKNCKCDECGVQLAHNLQDVAEQPRNCLTDTVADHQKCGVCGKLFLNGEPIGEAPINHAIGYHTLGSDVHQHLREGDHYRECSVCKTEVHEPHKMVLEDPLKGNYHQWVCECGELKTEVHYDKTGDGKCDECGHTMNSTPAKTEQHDSTTVQTGDKDTVKSSQSWWWNWQNVLTPSNSGGASSTEKTVVGDANNNTGSGSEPATASAFGSNAESDPIIGSNGNAITGSQPVNNGSVQQGPAASVQGSNAGDNNGNTVIGETETNVIMQFINWFLGLFGF